MSPRIILVAASAGTGKTYRLGTELLEAVRTGTPPARVLATTFTNRAAAELLARGRGRLLEEGLPAQALELMQARIGTVNAVFGGILADFALQNGRSPVAGVIPEEGQAAAFSFAAAPVIRRHAPTLERLAEKFDFYAAKADWQEMLRALVSAARSNRIAPAALAVSAEKSLAALLAQLPRPARDGAKLDAALRQAVSRAAPALREAGRPDEGLEQTLARLERNRATWADWARLSKSGTIKALDHHLEPVREAAARHIEHPQLRVDIESFVRTMFAAAAESLERFQDYKRAQGLVDFTDQEADTLDLLADDAVAARIARETDLLLVDEFQDTSPIQLALFLRLAARVPRTLFVGDTKQAIYGFRGADPGLVDAVAASLHGRSDVATETLPTNRRSRPALVDLVNAVFGAALPRLGIPREQVVVKPHRTDAKGQAPALAVWRVRGSNKGLVWQAIARRVARVLQQRALWPVLPPGESTPRPIRGGDIAVLMRTNEETGAVADALAAEGLKVALSRGGLLGRAECVLALAGLRVLADDSDTLALAEIAHTLEGQREGVLEGQSEGAAEAPAWLARALAADDPVAGLRESAFARDLAAAREGTEALTPAEVLDRAIATLNLYGLLGSWGDPAARCANLGALRALAGEYEAECQRDRLPATASGLAAWLGAQEAAEQPASPDPDAVQVMTCHKAKGLEWPMVVLADLNHPGKAWLFNKPAAMPRPEGLDPADPLAGRWIRLWPWPYGGQKTGIGLDATAPATLEGKAASEAARAEAVRLLYVAMTRARDYLVLAPRLKTPRAGGASIDASWLDLLAGNPRPLDLPATGKDVRAASRSIVATVEDLAAAEDAEFGEGEADQAPLFRSALPDGASPVFPPRRIAPSATAGGAAPRWRVVQIGERLPLKGTPDMLALGEALHGFFAADRPAADRAWREALAGRLLRRWGVSALRAEDAVLAADRLWQHLAAEFPAATLRREWPVTRMRAGQILSGRIDLLVERPDGLAVYDHKSFPGGHERWEEVVAAYTPQLATYAAVLAEATGKPVLRRALHLPISGTVLVLGED